MTAWKKGRNFLIVLGACYLGFLACLLQPAIQTNVFYLHRIRWSTRDLLYPEKYGFDGKRARSLFIEESIHAWHIAPLVRTTDNAANMMNKDQQLIIYLHGTAGTIAFPHRLTSYRIFTALPNMHVLAIDYRGFGLSQGTPSESGLIEDGIAAVEWAIREGFSKENIILYGQSLGSAVAIGVAHELATRSVQPFEIGKVVTVAAFESGNEIIKTYRLGGVIPILEPLRTYPVVQRWFIGKLKHPWDSLARVQDLAAKTKISLTFGHAITDYEIPKEHSERLFQSAVDASLLVDGIAATATTKKTEDGGFERRFGNRFLYRSVYWGGHNQVQWDDKLLEDIQQMNGAE
ncbi:Alpha/Beta hydrolase protein [Protomyces lactucae-debilis]|uniref:Alpha/Beta hydrolase protein n=1 Tax=Protomyces lactucae-debilis TaxID=2754530 RepID=A0A1Y2FUW6_PROLT|nr:Alpha/Beta hydrolase protein [Protomyces lactucae-debilis]ORY87800.1 Alpha/Beta hydrolase protein [Protomyces lactucae-debilis]